MAKEVIMPKFGFTQEEAEVVAIYKQNGDTVRNGDPLMEVTTDKVNMEVEATSAGILSGLTLKVGDVVPVATIIAYILTAQEAAAGMTTPPPHAPDIVAGLEGDIGTSYLRAAPYPPKSSPSEKAGEHGDVPPSNPRDATPVAARLMAEAGIIPSTVTGTGPQGRITRQDVEAFLAGATAKETSGKVKASPKARRLAREQGIPLADLVGSGPNGRIQGWDVAEWVARPRVPEVIDRLEGGTSSYPPTPSAGEETEKHEDVPPSSPFIEIPFTSMRRAIARNLTKSYQEAPHIFFQKDVDMTALQTLLETLRQRPSPAKLSMTVLLAKVVAWALAQHPKLNSHLEGETIRQYHKFNMGIAVALEEGLIVPVLRDVGGKGMGQLAVELGDLSKRARANQLKAADLADGTFTISNLGMFGIDQFTAIINPPQVAILAVGATTKRFVPDAQGQPMLRPIGTLTLSVDHRVIDGAVAAHFMATLAEGMTEPSLLLM